MGNKSSAPSGAKSANVKSANIKSASRTNASKTQCPPCPSTAPYNQNAIDTLIKDTNKAIYETKKEVKEITKYTESIYPIAAKVSEGNTSIDEANHVITLLTINENNAIKAKTKANAESQILTEQIETYETDLTHMRAQIKIQRSSKIGEDIRQISALIATLTQLNNQLIKEKIEAETAALAAKSAKEIIEKSIENRKYQEKVRANGNAVVQQRQANRQVNLERSREYQKYQDNVRATGNAGVQKQSAKLRENLDRTLPIKEEIEREYKKLKNKEITPNIMRNFLTVYNTVNPAKWKNKNVSKAWSDLSSKARSPNVVKDDVEVARYNTLARVARNYAKILKPNGGTRRAHKRKSTHRKRR